MLVNYFNLFINSIIQKILYFSHPTFAPFNTPAQTAVDVTFQTILPSFDIILYILQTPFLLAGYYQNYCS